jgi:hypothetical protein
MRRGWSRNEAGDVVLTMSPDDFNKLLFVIGAPTNPPPDRERQHRMLMFVERLNVGNPNFLPYHPAQEPEPQTLFETKPEAF